MTVDVEYLAHARSGARADEEHATGAIGFDGLATLLEAPGAAKRGVTAPAGRRFGSSEMANGLGAPGLEGHDPGSPTVGPGRLPGERPGWAGPAVDGAAALRIQRLIDTIE